MKTSLLRVIVPVLILNLALAGCGGSAGDASPPPAASSSASAVASSTAASTEAASAETGAASAETSADSGTAASDAKVFTKDTLAQYDGQNGNPAYVAVNGTVYDVTNVPQWQNGAHQGNQAGMDLTEAIGRSPHGVKNLENLPVVGTYE